MELDLKQKHSRVHWSEIAMICGLIELDAWKIMAALIKKAYGLYEKKALQLCSPICPKNLMDYGFTWQNVRQFKAALIQTDICNGVIGPTAWWFRVVSI